MPTDRRPRGGWRAMLARLAPGEDGPSVARGFALVFSGKLVGAVLAFTFNVAVGRAAGAEGAGLYYLAAGLAVVAATFGRLGLDQAVVRFAAGRTAAGDEAKLAGVRRDALRVTLLGSGSAALILLVGGPALARHAFGAPDLAWPLTVMALGVVPLALGEMQAQLLVAVGRPHDALLAQSVARPLVALALVLGLGAGHGPVAIAASAVASYVAVLALGGWLWRRATPALAGVAPQGARRALMGAGLPLLAVTAFNVVLETTDTMMLGLFRGPEDVGVYTAALRTAGVAAFALVAVNTVIGPVFAKRWAAGDRAGVARAMQVASRVAGLAALAILAVSILLAEPLLALFGPAFVAGREAFLVLALAQALALAAGPTSHLLVMTGHERTYRNVVVATAGLNVALNAILIPIAGPTGAALATATAIAAKGATYMVIVHRRLGLAPLGFGGRPPVPERSGASP